MKIVPTKEKLKERVKELTGQYKIAKTISASSCKKKQDLKKIILNAKWALQNKDTIVGLKFIRYILSTSKPDLQNIFPIYPITVSNAKGNFINVFYSLPGSIFTGFLTESEKQSDRISTVLNSIIYSCKIAKKPFSFSCDICQYLPIRKIKSITIYSLSILKQKFQNKRNRNALVFKNNCIFTKIDSVPIWI